MGSNRSLPLKSIMASIAVAGVVAIVFGLGVEPVVEFLDVWVPRAYDAILAVLAPPYVILIVNAMILFIAASFRVQQPQRSCAVAPLTVVDPTVYENECDSREWRELVEVTHEMKEKSVEKPFVSRRYGNRRSWSVKANNEGKTSRRMAVLPKRNQTMESTWRSITEGRCHKKHENWDVQDDDNEGKDTKLKVEDATMILNLESFDNTKPLQSLSPQLAQLRLRHEASVGKEELNRRVESFIKKFNEELRLQREESLKRYMEMINSGSH